jgi:hypothetical protein
VGQTRNLGIVRCRTTRVVIIRVAGLHHVNEMSTVDNRPIHDIQFRQKSLRHVEGTAEPRACENRHDGQVLSSNGSVLGGAPASTIVRWRPRWRSRFLSARLSAASPDPRSSSRTRADQAPSDGYARHNEFVRKTEATSESGRRTEAVSMISVSPVPTTDRAAPPRGQRSSSGAPFFGRSKKPCWTAGKSRYALA